MLSNKLTVREIRQIKNPDILVDIIYRNFGYLSHITELGHNREEIKRLLTNRDFIGFFVYNNSGRIVAYLIGEIKHLNDGRICYYISYFFTSPAYRGRGIGSQLMNILHRKCKEWGIKCILLTVDIYNKKTYNFYLKKNYMPDVILRNYGRHEVLSIML